MDSLMILKIFVAAMLYLTSAMVAMIAASGDWDFEEAFWWPILVIKILLKSLFAALFTGWRS